MRLSLFRPLTSVGAGLRPALGGSQTRPYTRHRPSPRLLATVLLLAVTLAGALTANSARADGAVTAVRQTATGNFPHSIDFSATLQSSVALRQAMLLYHIGNNPAVVQQQAKLARNSDGTYAVSYHLNSTMPWISAGAHITYWWEADEPDGTPHETMPGDMTYMDNRHAWRHVTGGLLTVYWYNGGVSFGQQALTVSQGALSRISQSFGATPRQPISVYIYGSQQDLLNALQPGAFEWVGGEALPDLNEVMVDIAPNDSQTIQRDLPHELSHIVFHQVTDNPYAPPPPWLDEGLAVYNQQYKEPELQSTLDEAVSRQALIPIPDLNSAFPPNSDTARLDYAESLSIVQYITTRYGTAKIAVLAATFVDGATADDAVRAAFGISLDQLNVDWQHSLGVTTPTTAATPVPGSPTRVVPGPSGTGTGTSQPTPLGRFGLGSLFAVFIFILAAFIILVVLILTVLFFQSRARAKRRKRLAAMPGPQPGISAGQPPYPPYPLYPPVPGAWPPAQTPPGGHGYPSAPGRGDGPPGSQPT